MYHPDSIVCIAQPRLPVYDTRTFVNFAGFARQKKAEEDATFRLIKDATFFPLF
jgi:hypothetical protein